MRAHCAVLVFGVPNDWHSTNEGLANVLLFAAVTSAGRGRTKLSRMHRESRRCLRRDGLRPSHSGSRSLGRYVYMDGFFADRVEVDGIEVASNDAGDGFVARLPVDR